MKFIIETTKSQNEVLEILKCTTQSKTSVFDFSNNGKYFNGTFFESSFKIKRHITYRNSFLPVIVGTIEQTDFGSRVNVHMRLNRFVTTFWFGARTWLSRSASSPPSAGWYSQVAASAQATASC